MPSLAEVGKAALKKKKKPPSRAYRVNVNGPATYANLPSTIKLILNHYQALATLTGRASLCFTVPILPLTTNHDKRAAINKATGKAFIYTKSEAKEIKRAVEVAMMPLRSKWTDRGTGTLAAVLIWESPLWMTKAHGLRERDVDNPVKPMLDAIKEASANPDHKFWDLHVFKVQSKQTRAHVYLYDLGEIVEVYS
jgi:Holliday junction resolvase RusA-like endonuclease